MAWIAAPIHHVTPRTLIGWLSRLDALQGSGTILYGMEKAIERHKVVELVGVGDSMMAICSREVARGSLGVYLAVTSSWSEA